METAAAFALPAAAGSSTSTASAARLKLKRSMQNVLTLIQFRQPTTTSLKSPMVQLRAKVNWLNAKRVANGASGAEGSVGEQVRALGTKYNTMYEESRSKPVSVRTTSHH